MLLGLSVRQVMGVIAAGCVGLLAYGLYLQHVEGLVPRPTRRPVR